MRHGRAKAAGPSSTRASRAPNKLETLKGKLLAFKQRVQVTRQFETSALASTSGVAASKPFWGSCCRDLSTKLWSPTETASCALDTSSLRSSSSGSEPFYERLSLRVPTPSPTSQTTCLQSLRFLPPVITGDVPNDADPKVHCRKVRFFPTAKQKELLTKCCDANRFMFNAANAFVKCKVREATALRLAELRLSQRLDLEREMLAQGRVVPARCIHVWQSGKQKGRRCPSPVADGQEFFCTAHSGRRRTGLSHPATGGDSDAGSDADASDDDAETGVETGRLGISYDFLNLARIRNHVLVPDSKLTDDHPDRWLKDVPYDTRQLAIKELVTAWKSALTNKRRGHIRTFDIGFKRKKNRRQIFHVDKDAFDPGARVIFKRRAKKGGGKLRTRRRDIRKVVEDGGVTGDLTILLVRPNKWFLCLPKRKDPERAASVFSLPVYRSVFIDPGVRTFATFYSPDGVAGKIGDRYYEVLEPLARRVDRLNASLPRVYHKHKVRMRRRMRKLWHRMRCIVDELHVLTCRFLCSFFETIFIPKLDTKRMSRLPGRKINCKATRQMMTLAHGRFLERLKAFARTKQRSVVVVSEAYTTKTCDACGHLNDKVGGAEVFRCKRCGHVADRDLHAARNIALRTAQTLA